MVVLVRVAVAVAQAQRVPQAEGVVTVLSS
jgi:hypothetical protein